MYEKHDGGLIIPKRERRRWRISRSDALSVASVIVATFAAFFAFWQAWESQQSRVEARKSATELVQATKKAQELAEISAMAAKTSADASRKLADIQERALNEELYARRSQLAVLEFKAITKQPLPNMPVGIAVRIVNRGALSAEKVRSIFEVQVADTPKLPDRNAAHDNPPMSKDEVMMFTSPKNRLITPDEYRDILDGSKRLYVVGRIMFSDRYGSRPDFVFCTEWRPEGVWPVCSEQPKAQ